MGKCKGVCRECEHAESTSVWDQYWCTKEDSIYYDCRRNGDEYCKAFEEKETMPDLKRCLNCKWRSEEESNICMCEESDRLSDYVDKNETCEHWVFMGD